ncbi:MAG: DNA methylase N-4/N-6 [Alphaproteobacteria bacterium]|nr:DNA methylase N-4/N-6 [Alphaproteobacteria bacterium]
MDTKSGRGQAIRNEVEHEGANVRKQATNSTKPVAGAVARLYARALPASRAGALYGAFPYPTKISPEAIALFIAAHTKPGDAVFDGFGGSGTTGLAAQLCGTPSAEMRSAAARLGLNVQWGARRAVLYEIGALGAFVSRTLTNPPEPESFRETAQRVLREAEEEDGWMYGAAETQRLNGAIRYVIWSDQLRCPNCRREVSLWDACVSRNPARIRPEFSCQGCRHQISLEAATRITGRLDDDVIGHPIEGRVRRPAWVYGVTGTTSWSRQASSQDAGLIDRIAGERIPESVPRLAIPWGDLYRRGYHQGVTHLHHFYTRRNLIVFGKLWERASSFPAAMRDALRFWLLSYNAAHATIMTRVVAKSGQQDLVVTSAQPGVLYVSGLPVEKNLFAGLRRKLSTITKAFGEIYSREGRVEVYEGSSCKTHLADGSVDYVFTDPPFGGNIPYAEVNFINEAWLGRFTDRREEAIVSDAQGKGLGDYQALLTSALREAHRVLRSGGKATVVFHSATAEVWNALQSAYSDAGLSVECTGVLEKLQGSFKQVTAPGAVRGDPVLLLGKEPAKARRTAEEVWQVAERLCREARHARDPVEQSAHRLYARLVSYYLAAHQQVPLDADSFYRWLAEQSFAQDTAGARE